MDDLRKALRHARLSHFGIKGALDDNTELFTSGIIDSLGVSARTSTCRA
jgi:hypothetical protein